MEVKYSNGEEESENLKKVVISKEGGRDVGIIKGRDQMRQICEGQNKFQK